MAVSGHNGNNETKIGSSSSVGLSFYDLTNKEIPITNSNIDIVLQRDSSINESPFQYVNATMIQNSTNSYFLPNAFNITSTNASIHIELKPLDVSVAYILVMKLGSLPIINSTYANYDMFNFFCPSK